MVLPNLDFEALHDRYMKAREQATERPTTIDPSLLQQSTQAAAPANNNNNGGFNSQQNEQAQQDTVPPYEDPNLGIPGFDDFVPPALEDGEDLEKTFQDVLRNYPSQRREEAATAPLQHCLPGLDVPEQLDEHSPIDDRLATAFNEDGYTIPHFPWSGGTAIYDGQDEALAHASLPFQNLPLSLIHI